MDGAKRLGSVFPKGYFLWMHTTPPPPAAAAPSLKRSGKLGAMYDETLVSAKNKSSVIELSQGFFENIGVVAQLVERHVCNVDVESSSLFSSTMFPGQ